MKDTFMWAELEKMRSELLRSHAELLRAREELEKEEPKLDYSLELLRVLHESLEGDDPAMKDILAGYKALVETQKKMDGVASMTVGALKRTAELLDRVDAALGLE